MINVENRHYVPNEKIGSDAFKLEYEPSIPKQVLVDDIVSYLGEYRFKLPEYSYRLGFADGQLIDPNRHESMVAMSQRAIDLKNSQNKSSVREQAEKAGFRNLDQQLRNAKNGDTIIWMSPMGPKSEGYGDYGFVFFGKVNGGGYEKEISMIAKRIESPTLEQFNNLNEIITQEKTNYQKAEDFLSHPKVLGKDIPEKDLDVILKEVFSLKPNKEVQEIFKRVINQMSSIIADLAELLKNPWRTIREKLKGLNSVENYALNLKNDYENYQKENVIYLKNSDTNLKVLDIIGDFGHKPPVVAGSCGSSSNKNSLTSSNIFSKGSFLNNLFGEQEWFHCPKCDFQADGPIGNTCPGCNLTKAEYARETGISCG